VYLIWNIILHDRHLSFSVAWALEFGTVRGNGRPRVHGTSGTPLATPLLARSPPRWLRRRHLDKHSICTAVRASDAHPFSSYYAVVRWRCRYHLSPWRPPSSPTPRSRRSSAVSWYLSCSL